MLAAGRVPETPLASVQAYIDWRLFGALPCPGGSFDQPAELLEEMRVVASAVNAKTNRDNEQLEKQMRRMGARR